jgi:hypothetical protein
MSNLTPAIDAARIHLHRTHEGNPGRAVWYGRKSHQDFEPLPIDYIRSQPGKIAWVAATADKGGITVVDSGGRIELIEWAELLPPTNETTKP